MVFFVLQSLHDISLDGACGGWAHLQQGLLLGLLHAILQPLQGGLVVRLQHVQLLHLRGLLRLLRCGLPLYLQVAANSSQLQCLHLAPSPKGLTWW